MYFFGAIDRKTHKLTLPLYYDRPQEKFFLGEGVESNSRFRCARKMLYFVTLDTPGPPNSFVCVFIRDCMFSVAAQEVMLAIGIKRATTLESVRSIKFIIKLFKFNTVKVGK